MAKRSISPIKRCSKCGFECLRIEASQHFSRLSTAKDGLQSFCKQCNAQYHANNKQRIGERSRKYREVHAEQLRVKRHEYHIRNRERLNARAREYHATHPQKDRTEYSRQYHHDHAEKEREYRRNHYLSHLEEERVRKQKYYKENKNKVKERTDRYRASHPDETRAIVIRRRARKRNLPDTFTPSDWQYALNYFHGCCAYCGRPPGLWHTLAMDHFIPLSSPECPGTVASNIVPACHSMKDGEGCCNKSKNNSDPLEWLIRRFGKRKGKTIYAQIQVFLKSR